MKTLVKLSAIFVFAVFAAVMLANSSALSNLGPTASAQTIPKPTPPAANTAANTAAKPPAEPAKPAAGDKKIPKSFTLGKDSISEYGEVAFDHDTHAFQKYSPDGQSVVGCVECHHTDQPKSAIKPPYVTSERDVVLTLATWQASAQKVNECRFCHFQSGNVPDGKEMPLKGTKELNNELAYHINCNTCHDDAAKLRPELKKKAGFATANDCTTCHKSN